MAIRKSPAELLNEAAAANTALVNRTAAGLTAPTTALFDVAGQTLPAGFKQDLTGRIFKVGTTGSDPVISSEDVAGEFDDNVSQLEERTERAREATPTTEVAKDGVVTEKAVIDTTAETTKTETGTPLLNEVDAGLEADRVKYEEAAQRDKETYDKLFSENLASINATAAAFIQGLRETYGRRIEVQKRINQIRIDRTKAYGLGTDVARFLPQEYTDAVTIREEDAIREITSLESMRNSLIARAEAAARQGRSDNLRTLMEDIAGVEESLQKNLDRLREESERELKMQLDSQKAIEKEEKDRIEESRRQFALLSGAFVDEYDALDDGGKLQLVQELARKYGISIADIYGNIQSASDEASALRSEEEKEAQEEARGELRTVGGDLFQVIFDESGKATPTLIQKGKVKATGGGVRKLSPPQKKTMRDSGLDPDNAEDVALYRSGDYGEATKDDAADELFEGIKGGDFTDSLVGSDGYLSPEGYATAKKMWMGVGAGYTGKEFDKLFAIFRNPDQSVTDTYKLTD